MASKANRLNPALMDSAALRAGRHSRAGEASLRSNEGRRALPVTGRGYRAQFHRERPPQIHPPSERQ